MSGGTFFKVGGHKYTSKNYRIFLRFELAAVTSQALKYEQGRQNSGRAEAGGK